MSSTLPPDLTSLILLSPSPVLSLHCFNACRLAMNPPTSASTRIADIVNSVPTLLGFIAKHNRLYLLYLFDSIVSSTSTISSWLQRILLGRVFCDIHRTSSLSTSPPSFWLCRDCMRCIIDFVPCTSLILLSPALILSLHDFNVYCLAACPRTSVIVYQY